MPTFLYMFLDYDLYLRVRSHRRRIGRARKSCVAFWGRA